MPASLRSLVEGRCWTCRAQPDLGLPLTRKCGSNTCISGSGSACGGQTLAPVRRLAARAVAACAFVASLRLHAFHACSALRPQKRAGFQ